MINFGPASHHDVLALLVQFAVLLASARILGNIAKRFGQPVVAGEILAGILLGPSFLATSFPDLGTLLIPQNATQGHLLELLGMLGAMLLLLFTGLEVDIPLIRRYIKPTLLIGITNLFISFAIGFWIAGFFPESVFMTPEKRLTFQFFVGSLVSISAIPVMAKVLMDLNMLRSTFGQTVIAIGMLDDTIAWIVLSVVLLIAKDAAPTTHGVFFTAAEIVVFIVAVLTIGRYLFARLFAIVQERIDLQDKMLTFLIVSAFLVAAAAQFIGVEAVLGAFLVGIIFGTFRRFPSEVIHTLESVTMGIFAPVFFALAGLKVNLRALAEPETFFITIIVIFFATAGKLSGAFIGAKFSGFSNWKALAYGSALNARGAVGLIIAAIGLQNNIISQQAYTVVVIMAITTSIVAPFMLRYAISKFGTDPEEIARLERENDPLRQFSAMLQRVLMPVRSRASGYTASQRVASAIMKRLSRNQPLSITLMTVTEKSPNSEADEALSKCAKLFSTVTVLKKMAVGNKASEIILDEVGKNYDLMLLGATERTNSQLQQNLFNPIVDYLVRTAPVPTLVTHGAGINETWEPNRILVPVSGTIASRHAVELALSVATEPNGEVLFVHVIPNDTSDLMMQEKRQIQLNEEILGNQVLRNMSKRAEERKVRHSMILQRGPSVDSVILDIALRNGIDAIIMGTSIRPGTDRLFLGPRVERILYLAQCPVLLLNT